MCLYISYNKLIFPVARWRSKTETEATKKTLISDVFKLSLVPF